MRDVKLKSGSQQKMFRSGQDRKKIMHGHIGLLYTLPGVKYFLIYNKLLSNSEYINLT